MDDIAGCVSCGAPLARDAVSALCKNCRMPPFPAEPAFGSPEAVELAAETIQGFTPGPWAVERVPISSRGGSNSCWRIGRFHACIYDDWRPREAGISEEENAANARLIAAAPDLLAERDRLLAEVDRLRGCGRNIALALKAGHPREDRSRPPERGPAVAEARMDRVLFTGRSFRK